MHVLVVAALLTGLNASEPACGFASYSEAAAQIAPELQTGSLIFSEGDCLAVRAYTAGTFTHVAAVVVCEGTPVVYDSMNGVGVRKLTLEQYLTTQAPDGIHLMAPQQPFTSAQAAEFERYLDSQLGTPYSVVHYVRGERSTKGVHCSEYVTDALMAINLVHAERPAKVSPSSLMRSLVRDQIYSPGRTIQLTHREPVCTTGRNWCEQLWLDTKFCCLHCCDQMAAWFLCR